MALAETYANRFTSPPGRPCHRFWIHPSVMIGGNLNDAADFEHLRKAHGIQSVVNLDARSEAWMGIPALCECPVQDDGRPWDPHFVKQAVAFAKLQSGIGPLYVHCHIGVSRSPAFGYGILRWVFGMGRDAALTAVNMGGGEFGSQWEAVRKHVTYMECVERALSL